MHIQNRTLVSRSVGCFVLHPIVHVRDHGALQEAMTRPLSLSLAMLASGVALLVAAGLAAPASFSTAADAPKGGTRSHHVRRRARSRRSRARIYNGLVAAPVRHVREALQPSGPAGHRGRTACSGGRSVVHRLAGRSDVHLRAQADLPLPHRRAGDCAELRGRVQPNRPARASVSGSATDARDSGRRRRDRRRGRPHLRDPRPRTVQAANPAREAGRRLHSPADDALLLPDPPEHTRGRDRPPGRVRAVLLRRADHQPADRARAQPVLPRRPPRERRPDRLDARREPRGMPRGDRGRPRRPLRRAGSSPHRVSGTRREVRPQPARRTALRPTRPRGVVHRLQPRSARVRRAGTDPAQESDQLRDRPA